MKRILLLSVVFFGLLSGLQAQQVRKTYTVPRHYNEIRAIGAFSIVYSDKYDRLTLVAPKKLAPYVKVEIFKEKPTLRVRYTKDKIELKGEPAPVLYVPVSEPIDKLVVEGFSSFRSDRPLSVPRFEIDADGAAVVECRLEMPDGTLVVDADGAAMLNLQGEVGILRLDLDGAAALLSEINGNAYSFRVDKAYCDLDGVAKAGFHCVEYIDAECDGVCKLQYTGNPEAHAVTSGVSVVKRLGNP